MIDELIRSCEWAPNPYLFFSDNVFSNLIYYSHLTPVLVSLALGAFVYFSNRKTLLNKALFIITLILSSWLLLDLILWATDSVQLVIFSWSIVNMLEPVIYAGFLYFMYIFVLRRDIGWRLKTLIMLPVLPTILGTGTGWNVFGFNLTNCDREVVEGPLTFYNYAVEICYSVWIFAIAVWAMFRKTTIEEKRQTALVGVAILTLLLGFASGNILGSFSEDWTLGQYGLFVLPISIGTLSYFIVQFRFFQQSQLSIVQFLVIGLWLAVGSILFLQSFESIRWIVSVTLVLLAIIGLMLIQSIKAEIEQRRQIERLARDLSRANDQQVTLIHFITHQIKGFVTKSRNIFAMMKEGDFGVMPDTAKSIIDQGFESDTKGIATIQEILNAANIKSGKVAFTMAPFDLKALLEGIAKDLKQAADAKGLSLNVNLGESLTVNGDSAQLVNAYKNLIDNSIKYTPKGSVNLDLEKKDGKAVFTISDTGVGITPEDMKNLFTEGGHGKESTKVNVDSTGFGLYIVKNIIEAHKGRVWAESDGAGKGSRFIVELPL